MSPEKGVTSNTVNDVLEEPQFVWEVTFHILWVYEDQDHSHNYTISNVYEHSQRMLPSDRRGERACVSSCDNDSDLCGWIAGASSEASQVSPSSQQ